MDVKEVVQVAKNYIAELFGDERIINVGLEEVDLDPSNNWIVTIGFSRPWDRNIGPILAGQASRSYKILQGCTDPRRGWKGPVREGSRLEKFRVSPCSSTQTCSSCLSWVKRIEI